jgi:hypothetical protein
VAGTENLDGMRNENAVRGEAGSFAHGPIDWVVGYVHPLVAAKWRCPDGGRGSSGAAARFRDNGEILYCIRSVRHHASWIRRIHVVLGDDGPGPEGLAEDDGLRFVRESQIVPKPQPNSETKKLGYHRIPDLAPWFITSDDDMFLGRPVEPGTFFDETGRPRLGSVHMSWDGMGHVPCPWRRDDYAAAVGALPFKLRKHFLGMGCLRDNPWVPIAAWLRGRGCVCPGPRAPDFMINDQNVADAPALLHALLAERPRLICINDDWSEEPQERARQLTIFHEAMAQLLDHAG